MSCHWKSLACQFPTLKFIFHFECTIEFFVFCFFWPFLIHHTISILTLLPIQSPWWSPVPRSQLLQGKMMQLFYVFSLFTFIVCFCFNFFIWNGLCQSLKIYDFGSLFCWGMFSGLCKGSYLYSFTSIKRRYLGVLLDMYSNKACGEK